MERRPKIAVIKTDGTNCDQETITALKLAGGVPELVHVNQLRWKERRLVDYSGLCFPGGFSYGDDIASARVSANDFLTFLKDQIGEYLERYHRPILGICNGFQFLARTGILPQRKLITDLGEMQATLTFNTSGHFECRWVNLRVEPNSRCLFLDGLPSIISFQVAHGEGRFLTSSNNLERLENDGQVVFRYCDEYGNPTMDYPENPNGALQAVAGICDETGTILGLMPHPERFVRAEQHPNWRRTPGLEPQGLILFENMVRVARES